MKKLLAAISACALLLALCACSDQAGTPTGGENSQTPTSTQPAAPTPEPTQDAEPAASEPAAEPVGGEIDPKTIAIELSERRAPVSELYEAIGEPISADYAPGCVEPDSEDGELIYDGFTVYTVRTADREYVYDVL